MRVPDEALTLFQAQSLVLKGELAVPQALETGRFYGRYDLNGKPRAPYPPMHALLASPWYAVGHFLLARLPGIPAANQDLVVAFAVTLSSATFAALTGALAFALFLRKGISFQLALASAAILALATPLFSYSGWFFSEPLTSCLLMSAAVLLFGHRDGEAEPPSLMDASLAGVALGAAPMEITEIWIDRFGRE